MKRTNGVPLGVTTGRDRDRHYFDGCHNVELPLAKVEPIVGPLTPSPELTLADAVHSADARPCYCVDCDNRRLLEDSRHWAASQLELPAELMPTPIGRLFA